MGATKDRRKARKQQNRTPWELTLIRTRKGTTLRIPCPKCRTRTAVRFWDPTFGKAVCFDCVPADARRFVKRQTDSNPDNRPMALTKD